MSNSFVVSLMRRKLIPGELGEIEWIFRADISMQTMM